MSQHEIENTAMEVRDYVTFFYSSRQGLFQVNYYPDGEASIFNCGVQESAPHRKPLYGIHEYTENSALLPARLLHFWTHTYPVKADVVDLEPEALLTKYGTLFLERDISLSVLEPPASEGTTYITFPVTMYSDMVLDVVLRSDGQGYLLQDETFYEIAKDESTIPFRLTWPYPLFRHDITVDSLFSAVEHDPNEECIRLDDTVNAFYEEMFWSRINPTLEERWIRSGREIAGDPLVIQRCDAKELISLLADAIRLDGRIWKDRDAIGTFYVETGHGDSGPFKDVAGLAPAGVGCVDPNRGNNGGLTPPTIALMEAIVGWAMPSGSEYHYVVGHFSQWSSYAKRGKQLTVLVTPPTSTEWIVAMERLAAWAETNAVEIEAHLPA